MGKRVLIGITTLDHDGKFLEQRQMHGIVVGSDPKTGVEILLNGAKKGESFRLPPDLRPFEPAPPGHYTLRATGEVVIDPDFLCKWTVTRPAPKN